MLPQYTIVLSADHLQYLVDVLSTAPLPYRETSPVLAAIGRQVEEQNNPRPPE